MIRHLFLLIVLVFASCSQKEENLVLGETDANYLFSEGEKPAFNEYMAWPPADSLISWIGDAEFCYYDLPENQKWENLGPFSSINGKQQNQGRIQSISVHPKNNQIIVIGSANGGIWKTIDGGAHWENKTDDEGFSLVGVHDMVRHPNNPDVLYAVTAVSLAIWNRPSRQYGIGLIYSLDGGEHWKLSGLKRNFGGWQTHLNKIRIDPRSSLDSTIIYAAGPQGVYVYRGHHIPNGEWTTIVEDRKYYALKSHYGSANFHDIEITKRGLVFFANKFGIYTYDGINDVQALDNLPVPDSAYLGEKHRGCAEAKPQSAYYDIAINKLDEITIVANHSFYRKYGNKCKMKGKPYYITQSFDLGKTWTPLIASRTTGFQIPNIAISPYNSDVIYLEGSNRKMYKSINAGKFFKRMKQPRNHVDVRCLVMYDGLYSDTTGRFDEIYVGNDGGISKTDTNEVWQDITGYGICNTNFFGFDVCQDDTSFVVLGAQDGNQNLYKKGEWYTTQPGGDNGDCSIDPRDKNNVLQSANGAIYTSKIYEFTARARSRHRGTGGYGLFPIVRNPSNPDQIFMGGDLISFSEDNGERWVKLLKDSLPHPKKLITSIAMSPADSNTVYYTLDGFYYDNNAPATEDRNRGGIFKLTRKNTTWSIADISNNLNSKCKDNLCGLPYSLYSVAVSPLDKNHLITGFSGFDSRRKVFESKDGGMTWKNITHCLPNVPINCLLILSSGNMYAGTDYGLFVRFKNQKNWKAYGDQGPKTMISDMVYNQKYKTIFVSTLGRGLWKVPAE